MPILAWFVGEVMETVDKKVHLGFHPSIGLPRLLHRGGIEWFR
jgi:hypothetical protein